MTHRRAALVAAFCFMGTPSFALAQGAAQIVGAPTHGHLMMSVGGGQLMDAGGPTTAGGTPANNVNPGTLPTGVAFVNSGQPLAFYTGYATGAGVYNKFLFGFDGAGNGRITLGNTGGAASGVAAAPTLTFDINGTSYPFPGTGTGTVSGPGTTTAGHIAAWNNPTGTLLQDIGLTVSSDGTTATMASSLGSLHESQGGVVGVNSNLLVTGDYNWLLSADISLYTQATVSVSVATAGETPGLRWTLAGTNYNFVYSVQGGDSTSTVAQGICAAVVAGYNNNTNGFKTALNATLDQQSQGMGNPFQTGCANQVAGAVMVFDQPYVGGTTVSALNSTHYTVTIASALTGAGAPLMDGGPVVNITRRYPAGYSLSAGDLGGYLNFQTRIGSAGYAQAGYLNTVYGTSTWKLNLGVTGGAALTLDADRVSVNTPIAFGSTVPITGPSAFGNANLAVISAGSSGFQVNSQDNTTALFTVTNAGAARVANSLAVNGPLIATRQLTAHVGTDQNFTIMTSGGKTTIDAINDAGTTYAPLGISATYTEFGRSNSVPNHLSSAQTTAPALTSCGTSPAISGTDTAGTVTMGTGTPTGCVISFNQAYTSPPHCVVSWRATPLASQSFTVSTAAVTLTQTATSSNLVDYFCVAPAGA